MSFRLDWRASYCSVTEYVDALDGELLGDEKQLLEKALSGEPVLAADVAGGSDSGEAGAASAGST
jgi:hypothetical protein